MPKLKAKGLKWLRGFHLITVSCWVGGGVSLLLKYRFLLGWRRCFSFIVVFPEK